MAQHGGELPEDRADEYRPVVDRWMEGGRKAARLMRFHHRAVPIVLAAVLIDTIGFGIVLPVLPGLVVHLGMFRWLRRPVSPAISSSLMPAPNSSPVR